MIKILIVNDDGISSPALSKLAKWAMDLGQVTVVAPAFEQSGKSQAIEFRDPFEIKAVDLFEGCEAYSVDSTPADCVRYGVTGLKRRYDIVFSGINRGYNLGEDISYSGTVGAILEAGRLGIKAIALSAEAECDDVAFSELDAMLEFIEENQLFDHAQLLNVNFPPQKSRGIKITKQGSMYYSDEFVDKGNNMYLQIGEPFPHDSADITTDIGAIENGYISITPLTAVKTDLTAYEKMKK
ncbi:MAG: 5'/3'-nucleotidase SurE [Clostridia bacterium]|nr:5'/3'-nucleotidase SurE [Clostridia bacterium]